MATDEARKPSGRGKAVLAIDWWPHSLPDGTSITPHTLIAHDGEVSRATLYDRDCAGGRTVLCLMHPRQDLQRHPAIPGLLDAGLAVWAQTSRVVGNDLTLVHESALLDVAAGCERLRELGYEQIVLVGISGGAALYSFYAEQALTSPTDRIARTPAGAPVPLADALMPAPDGLALVAPHPGQGRLLLAAIDPSVADESDPLSTIAELDPFDPMNGFAAGGAHYPPDFVERYRAAQRERVARIDERARELNAQRVAARKRFKSGEGSESDRRASVMTPVVTTHRTDADLRCMDLSLDPSERPYGSVISSKPEMSNFGLGGFGRLATPDAWLSTWSGLSSNASLERSLRGVTVPTLLVQYTGDCSVFPGDVATALDALDALAATDVTHVQVRCDHFGGALAPGEPSGIPATVEHLVEWVGRQPQG